MDSMEGPRFPPGRTRGGSLGFSDGGCADIRASGANVRNRGTGDPENIPIRQRFHGISSRGLHGPSPRPFLPGTPRGTSRSFLTRGGLLPERIFDRFRSPARYYQWMDGFEPWAARLGLVFDERTSARRPAQPREVAGCPRSQVSHEPRGQAPARCDGQGSPVAAVMGTPGGKDSWFLSGTMASMRPVRSSGFDPRLVASAGRDRRPGPRSNDPNQPGQPGHRGGGIA